MLALAGVVKVSDQIWTLASLAMMRTLSTSLRCDLDGSTIPEGCKYLHRRIRKPLAVTRTLPPAPVPTTPHNNGTVAVQMIDPGRYTSSPAPELSVLANR